MTHQVRRNLINTAKAIGIIAAVLGFSVSWAQGKRYLVTVKSPETFRAITKMQSAQNLGDQKGNKAFKFLNSNAELAKTLPNVQMLVIESENAADVEALKNHPAILDVEEEIFYERPERMVTLPKADGISSMVHTDMPWGIKAVKAPEAWSVSGRGAGVRVAILDTGVDKDHPALAGRFEQGEDFSGRSANENVPYDYFDDVGHGTHVAGTIAADGSVLYGVAPEASILSGRVCAANGCSSIAIVEGVDWAISQNVDVINLSLGGPFPSPGGQRAYERAEAAGIVVVAASGNSGVGRISYPAAYATVMAVGAVDETMTIADFSQWGPDLDIVAPGVDVYSSVPVGTGRESKVLVDLGSGLEEVKSTPFQGSPELSQAVIGDLVYANLGKSEDFNGLDVKGKFALIQRGEIRFSEKVQSAIAAGATGVVIFNNEPGLITGGLTEDGSEVAVPVVMIEQTVGEQLVAHLEAGEPASASIETLRTDYAFFQGTSMASPHVAGVAALVKGANPNLTPAQVRTILRDTATPLGPNDENKYGKGLVDAEKAVLAAITTFGEQFELAGSF